MNPANVPLVTPLTMLDGSRNIYLKDETRQTSGAFKYRGAFAKLSTIPTSQKVVTASTGNHGIAAAEVASRLGHSIHVFVPVGTPAFKLSLLRKSEVQVTVAGNHLDDCTEIAKAWAQAEGAQWISGFDDSVVVSGYRPMFEEIGKPLNARQRIFVPVGGGGLLAAALLECNSSEVIAVQCEAATSLEQSLSAGRPQRISPSATIASGLSVPQVGQLAYDLCSAARPRLLQVSDEEMLVAMRLLWLKNGIRAEAAGAAALAGALRLDDEEPIRSVCVISGGNIKPEEHASLIS
jgi:threonine dehydratase